MSSFSRLLFFIAPALLLGSLNSPLDAQSSGLREGVRVRVSTPAVKNATGVVQRFGPDSLVIFTEPHGARIGLPQSAISKIEVSEGRLASEGAKKGAIWGGIVGLTTAAIVLVSVRDEGIDTRYSEYGMTRGEFIAENLIGSILMGAGIGALIKAERWDRIEMGPRVMVGRGGIGLAISTPLHLRF